MTLPADKTRCHDSGCPHNAACLRYLQRGQNTSEQTSHIPSCVPYDQPIGSSYPLLLLDVRHSPF
jgi:hypothetical protein